MPAPELDLADPPPRPDYSTDGVDLSLIRWMLSLTPAERLRFLDERINEILAIRELNAKEELGGNDAAMLPILRQTLIEAKKRTR